MMLFVGSTPTRATVTRSWFVVEGVVVRVCRYEVLSTGYLVLSTQYLAPQAAPAQAAAPSPGRPARRRGRRRGSRGVG